LVNGHLYNSKMDLREMGRRNERLMEVAPDHIQWQALVFVMLHLRILLPETYRYVL